MGDVEKQDEDFPRPVHMFPKVNFEEVPDEGKVEWSKGYLTMTCHNCKHELRVFDEPHEKGRQFILPITNFHEITLICPNCNSAMSLHYVKAKEAKTIFLNEVSATASVELENKPEAPEDVDIDQVEIDEQYYRELDESTEDSKAE